MALALVVVVAAHFSGAVARGQGGKPIVLDPSYKHDRWGTRPLDLMRSFQAYTVCFDSDDDDDGDNLPDRWAIPHWVAYEVKAFPGKLGTGPKRPGWFTETTLFSKGIAPSDTSYAFSKALKPSFPFDRGHMCAKFTAFRMGPDADWNTHTVLNACPQQASLNQGIWEKLERKVDAWADKFGSVWVICGPILNNRKPSTWLGQSGEVPVAIPDAFFKIIIRKSGDANRPEVLAFIFPNIITERKAVNFEDHLKSVNLIEEQTGLDFLRILPPSTEELIEAKKANELWE
jgi:DNA/RNA endonuclease G (NUC1)